MKIYCLNLRIFRTGDAKFYSKSFDATHKGDQYEIKSDLLPKNIFYKKKLKLGL